MHSLFCSTQFQRRVVFQVSTERDDCTTLCCRRAKGESYKLSKTKTSSPWLPSVTETVREAMSSTEELAESEEDVFTYYLPLVVIGSITSALSVIGSSCIVYMSSKELQNIKQRILLTLSIGDLISSTFWFFMPYMAPEWVGTPGAVGNHASCTANGFFLAFGNKLSTNMNAYLSVYFYLIVCRNWKEHDFTKSLQIGALLLALFLPCALDIPAAATQSINPTPIFVNLCLYSPYPEGCNGDDCERSTKATTEVFIGIAGPLFFLWTVIGVTCTAIVWWTVRKTFKRSIRYNFQESSRLQTASSTPSADTSHDRRVREVGTQALLYQLGYLNCFIWPVLLIMVFESHSFDEVIEMRLNPGLFVLKVLICLFWPAQVRICGCMSRDLSVCSLPKQSGLSFTREHGILWYTLTQRYATGNESDLICLALRSIVKSSPACCRLGEVAVNTHHQLLKASSLQAGSVLSLIATIYSKSLPAHRLSDRRQGRWPASG